MRDSQFKIRHLGSANYIVADYAKVKLKIGDLGIIFRVPNNKTNSVRTWNRFKLAVHSQSGTHYAERMKGKINYKIKIMLSFLENS